MSSKQDALAKVIPQQTYIGSYVRQLITEIVVEKDTNKPNKLKKGDVITAYSGAKSRPSIIIKVKEDYVISMSLTSSKNPNSLCESDSRFFGKGFFCKSYEVTPLSQAFERFIGVYDNPKVLNNAIRELRLFINKNI